ncbi:MAG: nucleotide sugar dehydrogenase [Acidimicrobiia bacterium]|nr:nucleotide sugar dehydrogenase [Acidimicrobiia bacterium]
MAHTEIVVLGLGYVGCVTAACFARLGYSVTGVDRDELKVNAVLAARAPFFEPGLEELIQKGVAAGRLKASVDAAAALAQADFAFICVGTPSQANGSQSLEQLERICQQLRPVLSKRGKPLVVVVRSTVFPGTAEEVVMPALGAAPGQAAVVSNPEFLREGSAVKDFLEPSLVVVGGADAGAVARTSALYGPLGVPVCQVSLRAAEMIKYACNAFHAVKIAFANEVGALSTRFDVDPQEVMATLCRDEKLNISPAYLKPGFAFGGSCLPKDLRALNFRASRLDLELPLLRSALSSNQAHLDRAIHAILALPAQKLGVVGLAFKENTDDVRESPVVALLESLIGKGRQVRVHDPHIRMDSIYGANRNFVESSIPHIGKLLDSSLEGLLGWADHLVIAQKQGPEAMRKIGESRLPVTDLVNRVTG